MSETASVQRFTESSGTVDVAIAPADIVLDVTNTVGAVALRGSDRDDIRIGWVKRGEPGTPEWNCLELEVEQTFGRISVLPRHPERRVRSAGAWIDLEIEVPAIAASLGIEIDSGAGEVDADGLHCRSLQVTAASGNVRLCNITAEARIQSASGDVSLNTISGGLVVRSASGDVAILGHRQGALTIETASGDVRWRPDGVGNARLRTVSGDIVAELPAASGWRIDFRSVSGAASLPPRFAPAGRKAWVAASAAATSGSIEARTVSGDLRAVEVSAPAGADADVPAGRRTGDRDGILRAVERGDLGVEDALRLLDDLPGASQPA